MKPAKPSWDMRIVLTYIDDVGPVRPLNALESWALEQLQSRGLVEWRVGERALEATGYHLTPAGRAILSPVDPDLSEHEPCEAGE